MRGFLIRALLSFLLIAVSANATISNSTVWEVRVAGSDTNGGGFVPGSGGTDWTQQNAAQYSVTDGVTAGTTTITSATANFGADVVGNIMYVQGGTGSVVAGWYQITARNSATSVTVDRTTGLTSGTGVTLHIGGALATAGLTAGNMIEGNVAYLLQAGSVFPITSTSSNVSNGEINNSGNVSYVGYTTHRSVGNTDTAPTIQLQVASGTVVPGGGGQQFFNIIFDGNLQTTSHAAVAGTFASSLFKNFTAASSGGVFINCGATTNSASVFASALCVDCEAWANTATPFTNTFCVRCIAASNTGATTDGFNSAGGAVCDGCVAVSNGRDGFKIQSNNNTSVCINCIAESNTAFGFNGANGSKWLINASTFNNTSGATTFSAPGSFLTSGLVTTASSAFVSAPTNLTIGNASLQNAAYPTIFPRGTSSTYLDIGAVRHQDPAAGSTGYPAIFLP